MAIFGRCNWGSTVVDSGFLAGAGLVVIGAGVGTEATTMGDSSVLTFSVEEGCATAGGVGAAGFAYSCWTGFGLGAGEVDNPGAARSRPAARPRRP